MKTKVAIYLLASIVVGLKAQHANNWFFGINAGLSFNTNPPTVLSVGQSTCSDNVSSISDDNGNLLFYTDGITIWNRLHNVMPNGSGLIGHITAGQSALIVPVPSDPFSYVIFHTTEFSSPGNLSYTIVDMRLDNGYGDVVTLKKNISLGSGWTEKMCAIYNEAGNFYWLLTHKWQSDAFIAFKITDTSVASQSVVTNIGSVHLCGTYSAPHDAMGQLTISQDGSKIINALTCQDKFELFQFNKQSGILSNSVVLNGDGNKAWGNAFSADGKKLYVSSIFGPSVFQYDVSLYNNQAIEASKFAIVTLTASGYNFAYMELAPDKKIYIAKPNLPSLAVINNPNAPGGSAIFSLAGQLISGNCQWGLCRIAYNNGGLSGTDIKVMDYKNHMNLYPNPVNDKFYIRIHQKSEAIRSISILDYCGSIVKIIDGSTFISDQSEICIDVSKILSGFYLCVVNLETKTIVMKFIKS